MQSMLMLPSRSLFNGSPRLPSSTLVATPSPSPAAASTAVVNRFLSNRFVASASSTADSSSSSSDFALLMEAEGVLMDIYRLGNRQAFNSATQARLCEVD